MVYKCECPGERHSAQAYLRGVEPYEGKLRSDFTVTPIVPTKLVKRFCLSGSSRLTTLEEPKSQLERRPICSPECFNSETDENVILLRMRSLRDAKRKRYSTRKTTTVSGSKSPSPIQHISAQAVQSLISRLSKAKTASCSVDSGETPTVPFVTRERAKALILRLSQPRTLESKFSKHLHSSFGASSVVPASDGCVSARRLRGSDDRTLELPGMNGYSHIYREPLPRVRRIQQSPQSVSEMELRGDIATMCRRLLRCARDAPHDERKLIAMKGCDMLGSMILGRGENQGLDREESSESLAIADLINSLKAVEALKPTRMCLLRLCRIACRLKTEAFPDAV
jgi:hypothetical protein